MGRFAVFTTSLLLVLAPVLAAADVQEAATAGTTVVAKLKVKTIYSPTECDITSKPGDRLLIHYVTKLKNTNTIIDSSRARQSPYEFKLGTGQAIRGWDLGLKDMCVGAKRRLTIPPHQAFGDQGVPGFIPAEATLVSTVELLEIVTAEAGSAADGRK